MHRVIIVFCLFLFLTGCQSPAATTDLDTDGKVAWDKGAMASAANPHAVKAAVRMLELGGHAVDAAIAAHAVLGLVEPQSSGLGGGAFMLVYENDDQSMTFHDGREMAPAGATVDMFMQDGEVMKFFQAWQSGLSVGVPGAVALYKNAHDKHGKLPWATVFEPAIDLATTGFIVSPRLANYLPRMKAITRLGKNQGAAAYFYPNGEALQAGDLRKNPAYAQTLRRVSVEGIDAFYQGEIAQAIANSAQAEPDGGSLSVEDLGNYSVIERPVVCGDFELNKICTTSPPSSGGAQIMIASLYTHLAENAEGQADNIAAFVDAQRLAYADRDHYFGDPDEVDIPLEDLLNPRYLKARAKDRFQPDATPTPGDPGAVLRGEDLASRWGVDTTQEAAGTSHLSIIDGEGNAVSLTATVEAPFGSSRWVKGFLLNNELTDFAREVKVGEPKPANAIAPGRRPRSSMSPTMVFDGAGNLKMVTGSPGGNSIPAYVAKSILGVLEWDLSVQEAVDHPNLIARGKRVRVEIGTPQGLAIAADLKERGYDVQEREGENSGLHAIVVSEDGLAGAADPRREGIVLQVPSTAEVE